MDMNVSPFKYQVVLPFRIVGVQAKLMGKWDEYVGQLAAETPQSRATAKSPPGARRTRQQTEGFLRGFLRDTSLAFASR